MPFALTLGFATEHDRDDFVEKILPKVRGQQVDPPKTEVEPDGLHRIAVSVTSPSAARDVCHQVVAFLAHSKKDRVIVEWQGVDGKAHSGLVTGESAKDAEILAVRVSAAAKAHLD
jgi:hypothetical protein